MISESGGARGPLRSFMRVLARATLVLPVSLAVLAATAAAQQPGAAP